MTTYLNDDLSIDYKSALFDVKDELKAILHIRRERLLDTYDELKNAKDLNYLIIQTVFYDVNVGANVENSLILNIFKRELPLLQPLKYVTYDQLTAELCNHMNQKIDGLEKYIKQCESEIDDLVVKIEALSTTIAFLDIK